MRAVVVFVGIEGDPIGRTADDALVFGAGRGERSTKAVAVFEIDDGGGAGEFFDTLDKFRNLSSGAFGVGIADEEDFAGLQALGRLDHAETLDEAVSLHRWADVGQDEAIGSEFHPLAFRSLEEVGAFGVQFVAFGTARDESPRAVDFERGLIERGVAASAALAFLGVVGRDIDELGRFTVGNFAVF